MIIVRLVCEPGVKAVILGKAGLDTIIKFAWFVTNKILFLLNSPYTYWSFKRVYGCTLSCQYYSGKE